MHINEVVDEIDISITESPTFLVAIGIINFSEFSESEQIYCKNFFSEKLSKTLSSQKLISRVIDINEGAVVAIKTHPRFLIPLLSGMRDVLLNDLATPIPIKISIDVNSGSSIALGKEAANTNFDNEKVKLARHLLEFAQPGQILASESLYKLFSTIEELASQKFFYLGKKPEIIINYHDCYAAINDIGSTNLDVNPNSRVVKRFLISAAKKVFQYIIFQIENLAFLIWHLIRYTLFLVFIIEIYQIGPIIQNKKLVTQNINLQFEWLQNTAKNAELAVDEMIGHIRGDRDNLKEKGPASSEGRISENIENTTVRDLPKSRHHR